MDKLLQAQLECAISDGFCRGLEAAGNYHLRRIDAWYSCMEEIHNPIEKTAMELNVKNHRQYAWDIRNLKERSTPDDQEDTQEAGAKEEGP